MKAPEAMACVNMFYGKLEAREVIFSDTATTVHFTIRYKQGQTFSFAKESHLIDENGNRYPLRSTEGIKAGSWLQVPESGALDFTMHFEPMPKKVKLFDFTEGDFRTAFMLLGIHDKKTKLKAPTPARYLKFVAKSEVNGNAWTSAAEIGIEAASDVTAISPLHNGKTLDTHLYDLQGRLVTHTQPKGIYIRNGQKILSQ